MFRARRPRRPPEEGAIRQNAAQMGLHGRFPEAAVSPLLAAGLLAALCGLGACQPEPPQGGEALRRPAWNRKFEGETIALGTDAGATLVVVGTAPDVKGRGEDHIYALDDQGKVLWDEPLDRRLLRIAVSGDASLVLAALVDGSLRAWSAGGEPRWNRSCAGIPEVSRAADRIVCWNSGEESAGGIAVESLDSRGRRSWSFDDPGGIWDLALSEDGETAVALSSSGNVIVLDGRGRLIWKKEIGTLVGTIAVAPGEDGPIAVGTGIEGESVAVYDREGGEIWSAAVPGGTDSIALSEGAEFAAMGNNTILGQRVYVFDGKGVLSWKFQLDRPAREPVRARISRGGDRVFATLEEEGQPKVLGWDSHGVVVTRARFGSDVVDYAISSNGDRMVVITTAGKLIYYLLPGSEETKPGRPAAGEEAER